MKFIFDLIASFIPSLFSPLVKFIKLELLNTYVKAVDAVRKAFTLGILASFFLLFSAAGLVIMHIALFMLMPWEQQTKAIILLALGSFYFIVPTVLIIKICSRRTWLKMSGAEAMHRSISGED